MESLGTCARVINEQLLQDCSKRAPPLTPPRVTTQSMASTLDLDRARAALMVAAGVTTAAAIVLSQRSIPSLDPLFCLVMRPAQQRLVPAGLEFNGGAGADNRGRWWPDQRYVQ